MQKIIKYAELTSDFRQGSDDLDNIVDAYRTGAKSLCLRVIPIRPTYPTDLYSTAEPVNVTARSTYFIQNRRRLRNARSEERVTMLGDCYFKVFSSMLNKLDKLGICFDFDAATRIASQHAPSVGNPIHVINITEYAAHQMVMQLTEYRLKQ